MGYCSFLKLFIPVLIRSILAGWCGAIKPEVQNVLEGTTVYLSLIGKQLLPAKIDVQWHYGILGNFSTILCDSKYEQCKEPTKYTQSKTGTVLTVKTVSQNDSGLYFCICYIENLNNGNWSESGILNVTREDTRASKKQHAHRPRTHVVTATIESRTVKTKVNAQTRASTEQELQQNTISTEITTEHHSSTTNSVTAKVESETEKTGVIAGQPSSRQQSERVSSAAQHEAEHNPGALYDQQASRSAAEQINAEYATVVPKKDRISITQQRGTNKVLMKEKEGTPEYATVVKSRHPGCSVEQSTQGGKDKNEHGPLYAQLDLVSRPRREAASKENGATEYVSIDFQKTTKLKSQQK